MRLKFLEYFPSTLREKLILGFDRYNVFFAKTKNSNRYVRKKNIITYRNYK